jgi:hypothetical protein
MDIASCGTPLTDFEDPIEGVSDVEDPRDRIHQTVEQIEIGGALLQRRCATAGRADVTASSTVSTRMGKRN